MADMLSVDTAEMQGGAVDSPMAPASSEEEAKAKAAIERAAKFKTLQDWFAADARHSSAWRKQAKADFDFEAGHQWSREDEAALKDQQRPVIVFNRTKTILKAVAGMEINGRHEIQYIPRSSEDTAVNEVLTAASKWMADTCDGEDEESEAFQNSIICGMGWTEARVDYDEDPQGKYIEESISPLEMYWDRSATKKNLSDARRLWRARQMPWRDAREMFPGFARNQLDAVWAVTGPTSAGKSVEERRDRSHDNSEDSDLNEVTVVHVEWWERETYYLIADPVSNQKQELSEEQFKVLQSRAAELAQAGQPMPFESAKLTRRSYKRAFLGNEMLGDIETFPKGRGFSFAAITGELDRNKGIWYGLIRLVRDAQMWANKWMSQGLHILNTTAKGGILAEMDAFEDIAEAEATYAKPDAITWVNKGAVAQNKIMPKPGEGFPAGFFDLMQMAITAVRDVTGINYELLGLKDVNQPGILEAQRKQAGMTILATMFDSLRRFRKIVGRLRLHFIQTDLSDGRLIRIVGPEGAKSVPLVRDATAGEYDVIVDDAPASPNQKQANWQIISMLMPAFKDQLIQYPDVLMAVLEQSPLPSRFVETIKAAVAKPNAGADEAKAIGKAKAVAGIAKDQAAAEKNLAEAHSTGVAAASDLLAIGQALGIVPPPPQPPMPGTDPSATPAPSPQPQPPVAPGAALPLPPQ